MTRRALLLSSCAGLLRADSAQQVYDLFADMAAALSAANPQGFLADCDESMPGYNRLSEDVTALVREYLVQSSLELNKNEGDDQKRTVEVDWLMTLRPVGEGTFSKPEGMASANREQVLKCTAAKRGRKWKIVSLEPLDFFTPPGA